MREPVFLLKSQVACPSPWFRRYRQGFLHGMTSCGVEVIRDVEEAPRGSLAFLQSPWDLDFYAGMGARLFAHIHGNPAQPFGNWSLPDIDLERTLVDACERVFTCSRHSQDVMEKAYGKRPALAGFPLLLSTPPKMHPQHIVVPGRLDFTRLPWVMIEALAPVAREWGCKLILTTSQKKDQTEFSQVTKSGYLSYPELSHVEVRYGVTEAVFLQDVLPTARAVVIGSTFDNWSLSASQAVHYRIPVSAPAAGSFHEFGGLNLYEPYGLQSIRRAVSCERVTDPKIVRHHLNPTNSVRAMLRAMWRMS